MQKKKFVFLIVILLIPNSKQGKEKKLMFNLVSFIIFHLFLVENFKKGVLLSIKYQS